MSTQTAASERVPPPAAGQTPEGFEALQDVGGFSDVVGPLYIQHTGEGPRLCFRVLEQHCNPLGVAHGGWLMAVMDHVIAGAGAAHLDRIGGGITVSASFDFIAAIPVGTWCETEITLCERKRTLAFVEARIHGPDRILLRCNGTVAYRRSGSSPSADEGAGSLGSSR